jgi:hypothetical protein
MADTQGNATQIITKAPAHPCLLHIIYNSQAMETAKMSYKWQINQENVVFIHNGILLSHKEEWNFVIHK